MYDKKKTSHIEKTFLRCALCLHARGAACITFAEEASDETAGETAEEILSPTPTPDPHTEAYYQPADTNAIPGWPQDLR